MIRKIKRIKLKIKRFLKLDYSCDLIELPEDLYQAHLLIWGLLGCWWFWLYDMNYHNDSVSSWFPQFHFGQETHWYKQI